MDSGDIDLRFDLWLTTSGMLEGCYPMITVVVDVTNIECAAPVSMKGRMTANGYQPENHQWLDQLLERDEHGKPIGRNPMDVDLDVLKSAGNPPRSTRALVAAWSDRGDEPLFAPVKEVRDIREHCLVCSSGVAREVRECRIINCPFWAYRLGRNPHNPMRGKRPTFGSKPSVTGEFGAQNEPAATLVAPPVLNAPGICPVEPPIAQNESPSLGSPTGDVAPARPAEASFVPS